MSYRLSTDPDELTKASDIVRGYGGGGPADFSATELLIATWNNFQYRDSSVLEKDVFNTIQIILATDGTTSAAIYSYKKIDTEVPIARATVGVQKNFNDYCGFSRDSVNGDVMKKLLCQSNAGKRGCFVYPLSENFSQKCKSVENLPCPADNIDECKTESPCPANANCTDLNGPKHEPGTGYLCTCHSGYNGYPYAKCADIDECVTGNHNCSSPKRCKNTEGSFKCVESNNTCTSKSQ